VKKKLGIGPLIPIEKNMFYISIKLNSNQSLVGLVVIDAELDREDHGSIPHNCDREKARTT
jgi:hypothetical protein